MTTLAEAARDLLRRHDNDAVKAAPKFALLLRRKPELLAACALDFLMRFAADSAAGTVADHLSHDAHKANESPAPATRSAGKVKVRGHHVGQYQRRTAAQKAAETEAWLASAEAIFDTLKIGGVAIGDLKWRELKALVRENAMDAASYLRLGTEATERAILLDKIDGHAVVADDAKTVREILSAKKLAELAAEAKREAPRLVERGMRAYAAQIESRRVEVQ